MENLHDQKVLIGLSGGINSMAVLCHLIESGHIPSELHLFYAHFEEHSPDTFTFVRAGIELARKHFPNVIVKITRQSVLRYFESQNMIPHPMVSPCSKNLKIIPINEYAFKNNIKFDLVGYVKKEMKTRGERQQNSKSKDTNLDKIYTIGEFTDEWCFEICDKWIGWHPKIYDLFWKEEHFERGLCSKRDIGRRVFKHNNCLPCKNMNLKDFKAVMEFYPEYHELAMQLTEKLGKYWGRSGDDFYNTFGRELGQESTCGVCEW